ncbi:MAG: FtsK/SpoIIIE family protein [Neobacillus sp.]|jgi:hypothetical protein|nr:FtsK/SpoIIIE family protein [Neobacillus sp.]
MRVPFFYDADKLNMGMGRSASLIEWEPRRCPNLVIVGKSGSGKSTCAQLMLARVSRHCGDLGAAATVCDYKNEYGYLKGCSRYYAYKDCMDGLKAFQELNESRMLNRTAQDEPLHILLFSEWAMFLSMQDKKESEEARNIMAALIMSVRAQRLSVWIDIQRADSAWFGTARDSLAPIALGSLSSEAKQMMFPDFKEQIGPVKENEGYFSDGSTLKKIIVPTIGNWDKLHEDVRQLVI